MLRYVKCRREEKPSTWGGSVFDFRVCFHKASLFAFGDSNNSGLGSHVATRSVLLAQDSCHMTSTVGDSKEIQVPACCSKEES